MMLPKHRKNLGMGMMVISMMAIAPELNWAMHFTNIRLGKRQKGCFEHFEIFWSPFLEHFFFRKATVIAIARLAQLPAVLNLNMSIIVHRHQPVIFSGWETHWRPWNRKCATARGGREPNLTWEMLSWLRCLSTNEGTPQTAKGNGNLRINLDLWVQYSQT